jgi:hypothetical protein
MLKVVECVHKVIFAKQELLSPKLAHQVPIITSTLRVMKVLLALSVRQDLTAMELV